MTTSTVSPRATRIESTDPEIFELLQAEQQRQSRTLGLIASENLASGAVMEAVGSAFTNKYAEGYPFSRYYQGCEHHDVVEDLARKRACELFGAKHANVQPHSGAQANASVFLALMEPGDVFASLLLADGGHLSHGMKLNFSGKYFQPVHYPLVLDESRPDHEHIDYDAVAKVCAEHKPKLLMCGFSAYPRTIDFKRFREIADDCGALLMADIAHIAGLVAGGAHPSPLPHAHIVTTTTHKTLRGARGGMILTNDDELAKKFNRAVFPGMQGGPLMNEIAGKAVAFREALQPEFRQYAAQIVANARALGQTLMDKGWRLTSGGTDNHLMLVDLRSVDPELTGTQAAIQLEKAGLVCNMNAIPGDPRPPKVASGIRLGTAGITTRGMTEPQMQQIGEAIDRVLRHHQDDATLAAVRDQVAALGEQFPVPA